jgi:hypothetical protein
MNDMNNLTKPAAFKPKSGIRILLAMLAGLMMLVCSGCATYFRTGELSYQEIKDRNAELQDEQHMMFAPGSCIASWK